MSNAVNTNSLEEETVFPLQNSDDELNDTISDTSSEPLPLNDRTDALKENIVPLETTSTDTNNKNSKIHPLKWAKENYITIIKIITIAVIVTSLFVAFPHLFVLISSIALMIQVVMYVASLFILYNLLKDQSTEVNTAFIVPLGFTEVTVKKNN